MTSYYSPDLDIESIEPDSPSDTPPPTAPLTFTQPLPQPEAQRDYGSSSSSASIVALVEIAYRCLLIFRTAFVCISNLPGFCMPGYDCYFDRPAPWYIIWFYSHEMIRVVLGIVVAYLVVIYFTSSGYSSYDDYDSSYYRRGVDDDDDDKWNLFIVVLKRGQLWWFIFPYLIYSAPLIWLSAKLWRASTKVDSHSMESIMTWISYTTKLTIAETIFDVIVLGIASQDFFSGTGGRIFALEFFFTGLNIAYHVATIRLVKSFQKELAKNPPQSILLNPAISMNQTTVVRPEPIQFGGSSPYPQNPMYPNQMGGYPGGYPQGQQQFGGMMNPGYQQYPPMYSPMMQQTPFSQGWDY